MNTLQRAVQRIIGLSESPAEKKQKKRVTGTIDKTVPEDRVKMEMNTLNSAVESALYPMRPDRRELIAIYRKSETDPHVLSQCEIAKSKLCGEPFIISRGGAEDADLTAFFKAPWFEQFIKTCFDAIMWGYTLVEFGPLNNGTWSYVKTFPRRHVEPFSRNILIRPGDISGIPYGDKPEALYLFEISEPEDIGLLQVISREVIWKNFARTDWSQASEKFGMPLLYVKTATDNKDELDRIEALCRNFASNGYIIADMEDDVSILETAKSDIFRIYQENARFCDEQISKCINGQTSTSDQKAFTGSAEVHERILADFHMARLRYVSNLVNYSLFPFLQYHGYNTFFCTLSFPGLDTKPQAAPAEPDPDTPPAPQPVPETPPPAGQGGADVKKKQPLAGLKLPSWVLNMQEE